MSEDFPSESPSPFAKTEVNCIFEAKDQPYDLFNVI